MTISLKGYDADTATELDEELTLTNERGLNGYDFCLETKLRLLQALEAAGFEVRHVRYQGELLTCRAKKGSQILFFHVILDSEEERVIWRLSELRKLGRCFSVRQKECTEPEGVSTLPVEKISPDFLKLL